MQLGAPCTVSGTSEFASSISSGHPDGLNKGRRHTILNRHASGKPDRNWDIPVHPGGNRPGCKQRASVRIPRLRRRRSESAGVRYTQTFFANLW
jgi:hypothetical protein